MAQLAVKSLLNEHRDIERLLDRLVAVLEAKAAKIRWMSSDREELRGLLDSCREVIDCHMRREEEVLFPALEKFLPREEGPLSVLRHEHATLRSNFLRFRQSQEALERGGHQALKIEDLLSSGRATIQVLRDHIYKEDAVFFPLIARLLPLELDRALAAQMEAIGSPKTVAEGEKRVSYNKREMIDKLKLEVSVIRDGGYNPSVHEPHRELQLFRDSITCLNFGLEIKEEPCEHCFLMRFVPPAHRNKTEPCHYIPLNSRGDTIASLQEKGDKDALEAALLSWLYATISRLESEIARERRAS